MELTSPTIEAAATRSPTVRGAAALASLPAIEPRVARLVRLLADDRLATWLQLKLGITGFTVGACDAARFADLGWIDLSHGLAHASAAIDLTHYPALASVAVNGDTRGATFATANAGNHGEIGVDARDGDAALRNAVAAILLTPLIEHLAALGLADVRALGIRRGRAPADPRTAFTLAFSIGKRRIECLVGCLDDACIDALASFVATQHIPFAQGVSAIRVPGRLCLGTKTYRIDTLRSLRAGDVLLRALGDTLDGWTHKPAQAVELPALWGIPGGLQLGANVRIDARTLTFLGDPTMTYEIEDQEPAALNGDDPLDISELNLPVKFELDTVAMPVVQLSALRAGYVVELPTAVAEARIRLTSYGQTIGTGELVTVGEQLGVRVLHMSHRDGSV